MPIFEYRCDRCGTAFEELVFSSTKVACPKCRAASVTKQLSVPARPVAAGASAPMCEGGMPSAGCCGGGACHQH
ncbi:MAG: zinc ribbon domain-containing protein [Gemmatimonadetes bacterium]|nr:zinc ribbon domain-containing protein [Gemmatimonadota bacterium]